MPALLVVVGSLACALVGVLLHMSAGIGPASSIVNPTGQLPLPHKPPWVPKTEEDQVVDRFVRLKNASDPEAMAMLGPAPAVPERPLRLPAAEALQAVYFLRDDLRIASVWRYSDLAAHRQGPGAAKSYILVTEGNVAAPRLQIWKGDQQQEAESVQRTMSNPDIHLRVEGGKLVPLRPELHTEP